MLYLNPLALLMKGISVIILMLNCVQIMDFLGSSLYEHMTLNITYDKPWKLLEQWDFEARMW